MFENLFILWLYLCGMLIVALISGASVGLWYFVAEWRRSRRRA